MILRRAPALSRSTAHLYRPMDAPHEEVEPGAQLVSPRVWERAGASCRAMIVQPSLDRLELLGREVSPAIVHPARAVDTHRWFLSGDELASL
jgi:hypothetical protein